MARTKKTTPAPVILTPEQIEAQARREERYSAYQAMREDLINRAHALAEKLHPGRVKRYGAAEDFAVMFGDTGARFSSLSGPGYAEMSVDLSSWSRLPDSDEFVPAVLRFTPRAYSLGHSDGIDGCEAQGRALIEVAAFARTLQALTA